MATMPIIQQAARVNAAQELCRLGARMAVLESLVDLPRERLIGIYRETNGRSPPRGQYPFSVQALLSYPVNVQASLFMAFYRFYREQAGVNEEARALAKAYRSYIGHTEQYGIENRVDINRAWTLIRFVSGGVLDLAECRACRGKFVRDRFHSDSRFTCCLCDRTPQHGDMTKSGVVLEVGNPH